MDKDSSKKMSIQELLERDGYVVYRIKGVSMLPMLTEKRDTVTVRRKEPGEHFKKNDVVLYKYPEGKFLILHRIIRVVGESRDNAEAGSNEPDWEYVIQGDNRPNRERGITDANIYGVLTEFVQDGKRISVTDPEYLKYVRRIRLKNDILYNTRRVKNKIKSLLRKDK